MLNKILKKDKKNQPAIVATKPDVNFIPYVCHYNKNTILTKNGELLKVIRITGFSDDSMVSELSTLRDNIRSSVQNHIKDNSYAFWFHTIRRKKDISLRGDFQEFMPKKINDAWVKKNKLNEQYVNEYYITIITEGLDTSITNFKSFTRSFSYYTTQKLHKKYLEDACKKLTKTVNNILADIEEYGAKQLGLVDWEGVLYSEPMRFFGKIINLYEDRYPLSANDMSEELSSHKIAFGERELEVIGDKNKNFASMLSLKEYQEIPTEFLDHVLQVPFEFIISQSFDFTFTPKDIEAYRYQNYILQVSGDDTFRQFIGADQFSDKGEESDITYGKLQTTFMLISRDTHRLHREVNKAMNKFSELGMVVVREDMFAEHCFWAQLPGNFKFLKRQKTIRASRVAGFAALHSFPSGLIAGNHWGPAVTVLKTVLDTPYFFNFHDGDLGHSLVLGPENSGKTVFVNFMLAQARKFNNKIFYFDNKQQSKCFIHSLDGAYHSLSYDPKKQNLLALKPLSLERDEENKAFLVDWFTSLVKFSKKKVPQSEIDLIPLAVDRIFELKIDDFAKACEVFNIKETPNLYSRLKIWNSEKISHIFSAAQDIDLSKPINGFDFSELITQKPIVFPVVNYLLHKIESSLHGEPAIIVLSEAWNLVDNPFFAPQMTEFLARMRRKNCVVIFTSEDIEAVESSEIIFDIKKNVASEIYLPNPEPDFLYEKILGLTEEEIEIVKMMNSAERHLLLKHRGDAIIASLNLTKLSKIRKILAADELSLAVMEEVMEANRSPSGAIKPEDWIPQFVEVLDELEKEQEAQEREEAIRRAREEKERLENMN